MKVLLILYPINQYVDRLIKRIRLPKNRERIAKLYQRLINKRYPGIQRVFVLFSDRKNLAKPYMPQLWEGINIKRSDIVIPAGVAYINFRYRGHQPKYADILDLCPKPIDELIIGGFHFWGCIDRFTEYAYYKGLNVLADEDLSDMFFYMIRGPRGGLSMQIPISRKASMRRKKQRLKEVGALEQARELREDRPWFVQI